MNRFVIIIYYFVSLIQKQSYPKVCNMYNDNVIDVINTLAFLNLGVAITLTRGHKLKLLHMVFINLYLEWFISFDNRDLQNPNVKKISIRINSTLDILDKDSSKPLSVVTQPLCRSNLFLNMKFNRSLYSFHSGLFFDFVNPNDFAQISIQGFRSILKQPDSPLPILRVHMRTSGIVSNPLYYTVYEE
ncbi:hypothetical protein AGLY_002587 [Aphis glycines]|uniref:Uncharacterized protein n=1 Tax=Aphis glycines TaxID=307491 RepID=A0A6G0U368_APHGL|nr:hypothetical protein AGLY_002587 [Aphis glycines]